MAGHVCALREPTLGKWCASSCPYASTSHSFSLSSPRSPGNHDPGILMRTRSSACSFAGYCLMQKASMPVLDPTWVPTSALAQRGVRGPGTPTRRTFFIEYLWVALLGRCYLPYMASLRSFIYSQSCDHHAVFLNSEYIGVII